MADGGQLLVYRAYATADLINLQQQLQAAILAAGSFTSQTIGGKSYTRDLRYLHQQLEAVQFVLNERTTPYQGTVLADFSQIEGPHSGQPAGTIDVLSD